MNRAFIACAAAPVNANVSRISDVITREHIISEIARTAEANGGSPLGIARFQAETGIKPSDWRGKFWARWGDALTEAGFEPNALQGQRDEEELLEHLAVFVRELGRFPVTEEIKLRARAESTFPWHNTLRSRFGGKRVLAARLREFALNRGYRDVAEFCEPVISDPSKVAASRAADDPDGQTESEFGFVYLLKSGRFYKVGRSNAVGRRERELAIQLPEKARVVHSIKTDDPIGIERYWHGRFGDRRKNGEWFELTATDVAAFKRRKFM